MEEILSSGGAVEITVTGNSMYPMLCHRKSQVRLTSPAALQIGDIPLYRRDNGAYILHRIVGAGNTYICIGDNQFVEEPGVRRDQILALVTGFYRGDTYHSVEEPGYRLYCRVWYHTRHWRHLWRRGISFLRRHLR
jgi:hypothetical protein